MTHYSKEIENEKTIHIIEGKCVGMRIYKRGRLGADDNHLCLQVIYEDDEYWFPSKEGFSSFWLSDMKNIVKKTEKWLKKNAVKDKDGFGWELPCE